MVRLNQKLSLSFFFFFAAIGLAGCSGFNGVQFPDSVAAVQAGKMSAIQGSDFGGHAPIVGGHVFVLEANPTATGYGQQVKSLITQGNTSFPAATDTNTASPTYNMQYVTTNTQGVFYITGDYTCDIGYPVYLYASGGNPTTNPTTSNVVNVTGASSSTTTPGYNGLLVVTFYTSGTQLLYQGEQVQFASSITSGNIGSYGAFLGTTQTVAAVNLSTTQFSVVLGSASGPVGPATFGTTVTQISTASNAAIANMALLGVCGDTSPTNPTATTTTNFSNLNFVFMNEVSTVAAAYSMAGFWYPQTYTFSVSVGGLTHNGVTASTGNQVPIGSLVATGSTSNPSTILSAVISGSSGSYTITMTGTAPVTSGESLTFTGSGGTFANYATGATLTTNAASTATNDALHLSVPAGDTLALTGLKNAARNAAQIYDIQGGNVGAGGDGDTHIARVVTPSNTGGVVPQAQIDTLGNLLANCVDSNNQYGVIATGGTESSQCSALFSNATSDGTTTGIKPYDTATAILNIAHHPSGEPTGNTTFMSGLFNSITGNVPFQPTLSSAPNDFTVSIVYSGNGLSSPGNVAIDASGNAWVTGYADVVELGPNGAPVSGTAGYATVAGYQNRSPVIDTLGNLWFITLTGGTANTASGYVNKMNSSGVLQSGVGYDTQATIGPFSLAVDANNNIWVANGQSTAAADNYAAYVTELNQSGAVVTTVNANPTLSATGGANALLGPYGIAMDGNGLMWIDGLVSGNVASITTTGTVGTVNWYNNTSSTASNGPSFLIVDQTNNLWVPNQNTNFVQTVTPSAATSSGTNTYNYSFPAYTGGGLSASTGASGAAVDGANNIWIMGTGQKYVSEFSNAGVALTPAGGYSNGFSSSGGNRVAIDGSGNVWMPVGGGNNVVVMLGAATPVVTPVVAAAKTGSPGSRP